MIYEVGQRFGFKDLIGFSFTLTKKEGNDRFLTIDSDSVNGAISSKELDRAFSEDKIYLKNGTITVNNT